jgi:hypothetical protein
MESFKAKQCCAWTALGRGRAPGLVKKSSRPTHPQNSCTRHHTPQQICCSTTAHSTPQHTHKGTTRSTLHTPDTGCPSCPNSPSPKTPPHTSAGWPPWRHTAHMPRHPVVLPCQACPLSSSTRTHTPTQPIAASATRNTLDWESEEHKNCQAQHAASGSKTSSRVSKATHNPAGAKVSRSQSMNASTRRDTPTGAKNAAIYDTSQGCTRTTMQHHRAAVCLAAWQSSRPEAKLGGTSPHATMQHGNGHMQAWRGEKRACRTHWQRLAGQYIHQPAAGCMC